MSKQVLVCGDPGSGKTTSLLTALLQENVPTFVADFDGDVETYERSEFYRGLGEAQHFLTYEPMIDVVKSTLRKVSVKDKGADRVVMSTKITPAAITRWMEVKDDFYTLNPTSALVIDSGTNFSEAIAAYYHALNAKGPAETVMSDYSSIYAMERALYRELRSFPCMVFVTVHLQHVSLGSYVSDRDEVTGAIKSKKIDEAMAQTETRWPSFFGRKTAREKPLTKDFSDIVKVEISGNKRVLRAVPDDDTTFLHSNTRCDRKEAVEGLRLLVREMKGER